MTHLRFINQSRIYTLRNLAPGNYSVRVFATSSAENGAFTPYVYFYIEERTNNTNVIVIVSVVIIAVSTSIN